MAVFSLTLLSLTGCKTLEELFGGDSVPTVTVTQCPALKEYPRELTSRAADELDKLPRTSAILPLVRDYRALRAACRTQ